MLKRAVFYSIQAVSYIFVVFMTQGYALNGMVDWLEYVVYGMRGAALQGGFTLEECGGCGRRGERVGYRGLFMENAGGVWTVDLVMLVGLGVTVFVVGQFRNYAQGSPRLTSFYHFLQYAIIGFGMGFNFNLFFSSLLYYRDMQLDGVIQVFNLVFAITATFGSSLFLIYLFRWSKQLNA